MNCFTSKSILTFVIAFTLMTGMLLSPQSSTAQEAENSATTNQLETVGKKADESNFRSDPYTTTVGFPKTILQIKLPGSELIPKPNSDRHDPVVLRVVRSYAHGSDYRYDLEYIGLDPGSYDLADFLVRKDESKVGDLPEIRVQVNTLLPAGRIEPNTILASDSSFRSYYLPTLVAIGVLWLIGLLFIMFWGWSKTRKVQPALVRQSLADRIRPLVEQAEKGELSPQGQAELERLLTNYWRRKLRLNHLSAHKLRQQLRQHPEAGEMLSQLDRWLYDPGSSEGVDIGRLLHRYKGVDATEADGSEEAIASV